MPWASSAAFRAESLYCGLCRDAGKRRTSMIASMPWRERMSRNFSIERVECPIVQTVVLPVSRFALALRLSIEETVLLARLPFARDDRLLDGVEKLDEGRGVDRFYEVMVEPGAPGSITIGLLSPAGHGNEGDLLSPRLAANPFLDVPVSPVTQE